MNNQNNLALAVTNDSNNDLSLDSWKMMTEQARMLVSTNFLPPSIKTPEQAIAIMLQGRELGIPTMAALSTINIIQNKPTISPQLMLALINRSGQLDDIQIIPDADSVTCTMKRKGRTAHSETFGKKEAADMGLLSKDNYKKQALTMYRWRAVAACARTVFPDVILGLYTFEEMGAEVNADGELIPEPAPVYRMPTKTQLIEALQPAEVEPDFITEDEAKMRAEIISLCGKIGKNAEPTLAYFDANAAMRQNCLFKVQKAAVKTAINADAWDMSEEGTTEFLNSFGIEAIDEADADALRRCVKSLIKNKHL